MIDSKERQIPRFPAYKEESATQYIRQLLSEQKEKINIPLEGIASGACGGDIIFHELCSKLNIPSEIFLPVPPAEFKKKSVSFAGDDWDERFDNLVKKLRVHLLPDEYRNNLSKNMYELTNEWMLKTALSNGGENMSLVALWNGDKGDGKGGTQHMINIAKKAGAAVNIIDINNV